MTFVEKIRINELMEDGKGYRTIAAELGLPVDTVKSWCRRHPLGEFSGGLCMQCGRPITSKPHHKKKKFCSEKCRILWWKAHPENREKSYILTCINCGITFKATHKSRKFCSRKCYGAYKREDRHD